MNKEKIKEEGVLDKILEDCSDNVINAVKKFIISHQRELVEKIEGRKKTNCGCPPFDSKHDGACRDGDYTDYNQALSDILQIIKEDIRNII